MISSLAKELASLAYLLTRLGKTFPRRVFSPGKEVGPLDKPSPISSSGLAVPNGISGMLSIPWLDLCLRVCGRVPGYVHSPPSASLFHFPQGGTFFSA